MTYAGAQERTAILVCFSSSRGTNPLKSHYAQEHMVFVDILLKRLGFRTFFVLLFSVVRRVSRRESTAHGKGTRQRGEKKIKKRSSMRAPHGSMSWPREVLRWRWFGLKLLVKLFWRFPLSSVSEQFWLRENRGFALRLWAHREDFRNNLSSGFRPSQRHHDWHPLAQDKLLWSAQMPFFWFSMPHILRVGGRART